MEKIESENFEIPNTHYKNMKTEVIDNKTQINKIDNIDYSKINCSTKDLLKEKDKKIEIVIENISKPKEIEVKKENGDDIFFFNDEIFDAFGELKEENLNNYFGDKIFDDEEDKLFILSDKKEELNREEFNFFLSSDTKERLFFNKSN